MTKRQALASVLLVVVLALSLAAPLAAAQTQPSDEAGLVIVRVDPNGPAAGAGVKRGDILLALGKQEINNTADWFRALRSLKAGEPVELRVLHGDELRTLSATVAERNGRAFLGLQVYLGGSEETAAPEPLLSPLLMTPTVGAQVTEVMADSPASAAGLQPNDLITAVDGKALDVDSNLADLIAAYQPGDQVTLTILRDDAEQTVTVTLGQHPDDAARPYLGIRYAATLSMGNLPEPLAPFFRYRGDGQGMPFQLPFGDQTTPAQPLTAGALVRSVTADSPAAKAGLKAGDVITAIDDQTIDGPQALVEAVSARKPGDVVTLTVTRWGADSPRQVEVTLGENPEAAGKPYLGVSIGAAMMMRFQGQAPGSERGGMRFRLPFNLGELQLDLDKLPFDLDKLPFDLDKLPFKLPVPQVETGGTQA